MNEDLVRAMRKLEEARAVLAAAGFQENVIELIEDAALSITYADPDDRLKDLFSWEE